MLAIKFETSRWTGVEAVHARPGSDQLVAVSITIAGDNVFHCVGHLVRNFAHAILHPLSASSDVILSPLTRASGFVTSFV
jgi:hypothetical protein